MGDTSLSAKAGFLLAAMAAVAVLEVLLPLRAAQRRGRWPGNLALTAIFLAMNLPLTAVLLSALLQLESLDAGLLGGWPAPLAVIAGILALDLATYAAHVLMHRVPLLWRVHRVHHSDGHVDVTTTFRQHPLETLLRFAFTAAPALLLGVPAVALASYRLLSGLNALLEHANLRVAPSWERAVRLVLVTPHVHKIHHSRDVRETDSNYGNLLSVFDRICHTWTAPDRVGEVVYGLDGLPPTGRAADLLRLPWQRVPQARPARP